MVQVVVKKWGNSFGVILPKKVINEIKISEEDVLEIEIKRKVRPLNQLFGTLNDNKSTAQIKNEMKEGWDD